MEKLNLYDKFFHSPNWFYLDKNSFDRFSRILRDDQILSAQELGIVPNDPGTSDPDKIYFSFHPHGIFFNEYRGIYARHESFTGYDMTLDGQFFILNSKLKEDYKLERGKIDCECTVLKRVELSKYLVGIGNAGYSIEDDLVLCFNFIRYFNGEIEESELIKYIRERRLNGHISDITRALINRFFTPCNNFLSEIMTRRVESFVKIGNYYNILRILEEEKKSIPLYDKYGYLIEPKKILEDIKMMYDYISLNLDLIDRDGTVDAATGLVRHLEEKYGGISR